MTAKELLKGLNYQPENFEYTRKTEYSSKMLPYVDNEGSFAGFTHCTSNILAEVQNVTAKAMCKGAK